jgi:hypothetical protein
MRQFVQSHPAYQHDSVIRPEIAHDLLMTCQGIGEGRIHCPELLGDITIDRYVTRVARARLCCFDVGAALHTSLSLHPTYFVMCSVTAKPLHYFVTLF